ncbi:metal-independent phosphoserine phosphatase [Carex littledalei]|uniref:Metal-independent phosphoserine phosphatase n=1 Tax=Carex littledalei TaxID=544730 RepID=A0A833QPI5_9POAL|nr:metal-independent phosphoserine phosphatase [Carex littledalei]
MKSWDDYLQQRCNPWNRTHSRTLPTPLDLDPTPHLYFFVSLFCEPSSPPFVAEIVVVRHGETSWNASRILQGHLDPELNEIGRQQAAAVANCLSKEPKFNAIYSSDIKRAAETAQIIANQCDLKEVILDQGLRERHLGDLQGSTLVDA